MSKQETNRRNVIKAQKRIDALMSKASGLAREIHELSMWVENEVYAPDTLLNLMSATEYARNTVDCLMLEASREWKE
jgi:hypothetical protein